MAGNGTFFANSITKKFEVQNLNGLRAVNEVMCFFKLNKLYAFFIQLKEPKKETLFTFAAEIIINN